MKNTIKVKKYSDVVEEYIASGVITPGMLIEQHTATQVRAHAGASGNVLPMFALEDELQGRIIDTNFAATEPVQCWIPYRGDIVNAILKAGQNVAVGVFLVSNGDGKLKAVADPTSYGEVDPAEIVGVATEAVNASAADKRILVRVI